MVLSAKSVSDRDPEAANVTICACPGVFRSRASLKHKAPADRWGEGVTWLLLVVVKVYTEWNVRRSEERL